jgi:hypothetical protein
MNELEDKLTKIFYECDKHKQRLEYATSRLKDIMPLNVEKYNTLTSDELSYIDQLIFRFSKIQDTMGDKLFPTILILLEEDIKNKSFIDRLNRLEELELIYTKEWIGLRKDRNDIAHEYSFNQDEVVDSINTIYKIVPSILTIYKRFYTYCFDKFQFVGK